MDAVQREAAFNRLWSITHKDFRGHFGGAKTIMSWAKYGGGLNSAATITEAELSERLAAHTKKS